MSIFKKNPGGSAAEAQAEAQREEGSALDAETLMRKFDKESNTRIWEGTPAIIVRIIVVAFSLYCIWSTLFSVAALEKRLTMFMALVTIMGYLTYPASRHHVRHNYIPWYDFVLMAVGAGCFLFFCLKYDSLVKVLTSASKMTPTFTIIGIVGLLCLMAQCGLHIPADSGSAVRVFHRVLADVGDEQSIEQSLSTFSAHMSNIVQILREVDDQSLLLFDELGAGTDPIEGAALAIAIIESARSQGALIAATTHYAELKTFAMTTAGVENASCEFDVQTLRPTYRLLIGIPGKSNAFAISRRLGLDESVIQAAQQQMDSDSVRFEDVLTQLEEKRQRLEKAQAEADRLWRQREEDARKARTFREQMEKAKDNARTKGEAEAKRIVRQAQAQADEIFAQLDQLRRQQQKQINFQELNDAKAAVRHSLNQAQEALHLRSEPQEPAYAPSRPIEVGDLVELPGVKMAASVLAGNNDGTLLLQAGKMKMTVKAQQVRLPEGQPKKKPAAPVGGSPKLNLQSRASSELDIRGYETLEAESVVENYIDSAVMAKLGTVTIIHGKGTGALRKAVHEMLKRNKAVKSFRLGRYGEGEAGVTVVELK